MLDLGFRDLDTLPMLPDWIVEGGERPQAGNSNSGDDTPVHLARPAQGGPSAREMANALAALAGECDRVSRAGSNERNNTLNRAAFSLGTLVGAGALDELDVMNGLMRAAEACGLLRDDGRRQVQATISSGLRSGTQRPREPLPIEPDLTDFLADLRVKGVAVGLLPRTADEEQATAGTAVLPIPGHSKGMWDDRIANSKLAEEEWLFDGLTPLKGRGLIGGQSQAGKSFMTLEMAAALITGSDFFGHEAEHRGGVLILAGEAPENYAPRMEGLRRRLKPFDSETEDGEVLFDRDRLPVVWREMTGLNTPKGLLAAIEEVQAVAAEMPDRVGFPLRLIIVDTMLSAFGFKGDPDAAEATAAMEALGQLAKAGGCFCYGVHHYGKNAEAGILGSIAWYNSSDSVLAVTGTKVGGVMKDRKILLEKLRIGETGWNSEFELEKIQVGERRNGKPLTTCIVRPIDNSSSITFRAGPKLSEAGLMFNASVACLLSGEGEDCWPFGSEGARVRAVKLERVRQEFYSRYVSESSGTAEQVAEAKRKAFSRGLKNAQAKGRVEARDLNGHPMVWQLERHQFADNMFRDGHSPPPQN